MTVTELIRSALAEGSLFVVKTRPFTDAESHEICVVHSSVRVLSAIHQHSQ